MLETVTNDLLQFFFPPFKVQKNFFICLFISCLYMIQHSVTFNTLLLGVLWGPQNARGIFTVWLQISSVMLCPLPYSLCWYCLFWFKIFFHWYRLLPISPWLFSSLSMENKKERKKVQFFFFFFFPLSQNQFGFNNVQSHLPREGYRLLCGFNPLCQTRLWSIMNFCVHTTNKSGHWENRSRITRSSLTVGHIAVVHDFWDFWPFFIFFINIFTFFFSFFYGHKYLADNSNSCCVWWVFIHRDPVLKRRDLE